MQYRRRSKTYICFSFAWGVILNTFQNGEAKLSWLESHLYSVGLGPREEEFKVLSKINATVQNAKRLSLAVDKCWQAILKKDLHALGKAFTEAFDAQIEILPLMTNSLIVRGSHSTKTRYLATNYQEQAVVGILFV